ncbi:MAG: hypothetical protein KBG77_05060 [Dermatophilaceae bacterium]|nr:hypothetical protein [Dermatophilaceae bacterium]
MPLTRDVLNRALHWGALAIIVAVSGWALWQQTTNPTALPPELSVGIGVVTILGIAWCSVDALRNNPRRTALRAWVLFGLGFGVLQAIGRFPPGGGDWTSPLTILMSTAFAVAGFAYNLRIGLVVSAVATTLYIANRWGTTTDQFVIWTAATVVAGAVAATFVIERLQRAAAEVEVAVGLAWRERIVASREAAESLAQQEWDGLVHDKVLGALLLAGRSRSEEEDAAAGELATDALEAFDASRGRTTHLTQTRELATVTAYRMALEPHVRKLAEALGLRLRWSGPVVVSGIDPASGVALREAIEQAIVNVRRHARCDQVEIQITERASAVEARVRDEGRGFDAQRDLGQRRGIVDGIRGRVERVGGTAQINSAPGGGTTVTLVMPRAATAVVVPVGSGPSGLRVASRADTAWRERSFAPVYAMGFLAVSAQLFAATALLGQARSRAIAVACVVVVGGALTILVFAPRRHRSFAALATAAVAVVPFVDVLNMKDPSAVGWAYWFVGSCATIIAVVGFRWSVLWAAGLTASVVVGIPAAHLVRDGTIWAGPLADATPQAVAFFFATWAVRAALDNASASIEQASAEAGVARVAAARADEAGEVARQRVRELAHVVSDQLQLIARGRLTRESREHCLALEAQARDILVAGPLLTPSLNAAIASARGRGARVILAADRGDLAGSESFQRALELVLQIVPAQGVVRALWRPDTRGRLGSISVVGDLGADAHVHDWVAAAEPDAATAVTVSSDDDAVLLTFSRSHERAS